MKDKLLLVFLFVAIVMSSCNQSPNAKQIKAIKVLEEELYAEKTLDREKGLHMIDTYVNYSKQFPKDTLSAVYLFKAGEIAMNLQLGSQSIYYYDKVLANFPNFYKAPECVFLKAFVYENELGNLKLAEQFYKQFIEEYPKHVLVKDAKASLEYLGKSPEELVKMFQEMNKE